MDTGGHGHLSGVEVQDDQVTPGEALAELRSRLEDGLARVRLSRTRLASKAGLSRTTVYEALRAEAPVPSHETVAALARALRLREAELLELRRQAVPTAGLTEEVIESGPGRPLLAWDPHDLEVHPAGSTAVGREGRVLPGYVSRWHDGVLADAVREAAAGCSRMVVLVGSSSTGKTRACWEAVQPLAALGWRLWHPYAPGRAEAALGDLHRVGPRTVVWLNEAQHYLGDTAYGERIAAAVHHLLITLERAPVLVVATLWPEFADRYTALPAPNGLDPHSRVRELLSGRRVPVPDTFDEPALAAARALAEAGDALLADALSRADGEGRVAQDLAGAPELLRRYEDGPPGVKAVLHAAMDARRLGVGLHLPKVFLTEAATDYLAGADYQHLSEDWAEATCAGLAQPVHGNQAPLSRIRQRPKHRPPGAAPPTAAPGTAREEPVFRLADFLEQQGRVERRTTCPPASFWHAAHTHLTDPDDLGHLARAAQSMHRLQWAHHLWQKSADAGDAVALVGLARMEQETGLGENTDALLRRAADAGSTDALTELAYRRIQVGDRKAAEVLAQRTADAGVTSILRILAKTREMVGDREAAEALAQRAGDVGITAALVSVALRREEARDWESAEALLRRAADAGDTYALARLALIREKTGDQGAAEALAQQAADAGHTFELALLATMRQKSGDRESAEALAQQAANTDDFHTLTLLAEMREQGGERESAEALAQQAANIGYTYALAFLAEMRERAGNRESAEALAQQAADAGDTYAFAHLAEMREEAGDQESAEALLRHAANSGEALDFARLAEMRERAGDREAAEALAQKAANSSHSLEDIQTTPIRLMLRRMWPNGLDPDGTPTAPWHPSKAWMPRLAQGSTRRPRLPAPNGTSGPGRT